MPAHILHSLFGEMLFAGLSTRIPLRVGAENPGIFWLGCQGPDIFYHNQITRPVSLEYGGLLHRRGFGNFAACLLSQTLPPPGQEVSPLGAYALGFMTHALLDRFCHPYIVYKSTVLPSEAEKFQRFGQVFRRGTAHAFFERILDVLMLALLRGQTPAAWDQKALVRVCETPPAGLKELLCQSLQKVFPERAGKDRALLKRIDNTFRDCREFFLLTSAESETGEKIPLLYFHPKRLPLQVDYLNLARRAWFYPTEQGKEDTRSFVDVYDAALRAGSEAAAEVLVPYFQTGNFSPEKCSRRLGNEGLSIQDETGKPCAPAKTEALPLDEILLQQIRRREFTRHRESKGPA
ncbi:MAG: hypothetical protein LBG90_07030 [Spirochaetaceae bacterium]|jgi:hypothetical protein|nr:hypothetical protein [Spirochaetaceae bacterium]